MKLWIAQYFFKYLFVLHYRSHKKTIEYYRPRINKVVHQTTFYLLFCLYIILFFVKDTTDINNSNKHTMKRYQALTTVAGGYNEDDEVHTPNVPCNENVTKNWKKAVWNGYGKVYFNSTTYTAESMRKDAKLNELNLKENFVITTSGEKCYSTILFLVHERGLIRGYI